MASGEEHGQDLNVFTRAYEEIAHFYAGKTAKRSGVPLMNHIEEGLMILDRFGCSDAVKAAFCLHPLVQADEDLYYNGHKLMKYTPEVVILVMEYRKTANGWLSHMPRPSVLASPLREVNNMLIADKVQNYKDFEIYHKNTHDRAYELENYFITWLSALGVTLSDYQHIKDGLGE